MIKVLNKMKLISLNLIISQYHGCIMKYTISQTVYESDKESMLVASETYVLKSEMKYKL